MRTTTAKLMQRIEYPKSALNTGEYNGNSYTNQYITEKTSQDDTTFRGRFIDIFTLVCGSYQALFFDHFPHFLIYFFWTPTHQLAAEQHNSLVSAFNGFVFL